MARTETLSVRTFLEDGGFTESLKNISKALSDNKLEYGLASSAARAYGTSSDELKAKTDFLTSNIASQKTKVDTLREAFEKAKTEKAKTRRSQINYGRTASKRKRLLITWRPNCGRPAMLSTRTPAR